MNILVISPHPDDETLGCGGTLLKHQANGDNLFWVIIAMACEPKWPRDIIKRKAIEIEMVTRAYGMKECSRLNFPAAELDKISLSRIIEKLHAVFVQVKPELVYLVHGGDVHTDHKTTFDAVMAVTKPVYMVKYGVKRILCCEIPSETEAAPPQISRAFIPNVFNDVTSYLEKKVEIMGVYQTENESFPRDPSAIRALARYRGSAIGVDYAEAFMLIRELM